MVTFITLFCDFFLFVENRDFPNGWAPLQHMIVEGLVMSGSEEAKLLAKDIAKKWIRTNYIVYKKVNAMHEKYDVTKCGEFGGGGEYVPQVSPDTFHLNIFCFIDISLVSSMLDIDYKTIQCMSNTI